MKYIIQNTKSRQKRNQNTRTLFSPNKKKIISKIRNIKNSIKKKYSRANVRVGRLQNHLKEVQNQMKLVTKSTLDEMLESSKIPKCQSELINEIFKAARLKNPKNRKYSENWLLLCMLFQIR